CTDRSGTERQPRVDAAQRDVSRRRRQDGRIPFRGRGTRVHVYGHQARDERPVAALLVRRRRTDLAVRYADVSVDEERRIALIDLLDRVLSGGVVITGDITLSIAEIDLVRISLLALISSISTLSLPGVDVPVPRGAREDS